MEFIITRTSGDVKKPCEKAYLKKGYKKWFVEIKTLTEGEIIISKNGECPKIERYDDYRE